MSLVAGENWVFYANVGGIWKGYACARSGNFNLNTGTIETTGPGDGDYATFKPTVHDFTAQLDGVMSLNEATDLSASDLLDLQLAKTMILCRFLQTSMDNNTYLKQGYFYLTSYTDTGSFDGVATFSVTLRGTGALTVIFTPPPPNNGEVFRYPEMGETAPATPGAYTWETGIIDKNIIEVVKDGRGQSDIILTGTPVGNEVLYDSTTGDFTWAVPFEENETAPYIIYQNL